MTGNTELYPRDYRESCSNNYKAGFDACTEILWPEIERLRLKQYTIECEAQHNKNLHEEELFNSDNLLKRLNEKKAKVADLEKENERLKEAIGYLVKVPTQSYEKELARKLADLERKLEVAKETLRFYADYTNQGKNEWPREGEAARTALKEIEK